MSPNYLDRFLRFLGRSQFLTYSALLHCLLIALLGTQVYRQSQEAKANFDGVPAEYKSADRGDPQSAPPPGSGATYGDTSGASAPTNTKAREKWIRGAAIVDVSIPGPSVLPPELAGPLPGPRPPSPMPPQPGLIPETPLRGSCLPSPDQLLEIVNFTDHQTSGTRGSLQGKYEFTLYVAMYRGGDWSSTHTVHNGRITGGAMPNLSYVMRTWTHEKIEAQVHPSPLSLASKEIFEVRPPFIYFSGTRDFVLADAEVENLRKYLSLGGAIWGDSSLPGRNSRFDLAFRREMERVINDRSLQFEALPATHPIYTGMKYRLDGPPEGVNFYGEPAYAIRLHGEIAVIYTPNDYGDMMRIGLNEDGRIDQRRDMNNRLVAIDSAVWDQRHTYYRNLDENSLERAYQFSTNLVYHLLTRWQLRQEGLR